MSHPRDQPPVRPPVSAGIIVKRSLSCDSLSNIPGKVSLLLFRLFSVLCFFLFFLLQVPRINEALSSPTATDPEVRERCYRLTLETPPIGRSTLGREPDLLWQRYGIEYRVEGVFGHPAEMPLLMDPVVDHRLVRRLPTALSSSSSEETGETRRALKTSPVYPSLTCLNFVLQLAAFPFLLLGLRNPHSQLTERRRVLF